MESSYNRKVFREVLLRMSHKLTLGYAPQIAVWLKVNKAGLAFDQGQDRGRTLRVDAGLLATVLQCNGC